MPCIHIQSDTYLATYRRIAPIKTITHHHRSIILCTSQPRTGFPGPRGTKCNEPELTGPQHAVEAVSRIGDASPLQVTVMNHNYFHHWQLLLFAFDPSNENYSSKDSIFYTSAYILGGSLTIENNSSFTADVVRDIRVPHKPYRSTAKN